MTGNPDTVFVTKNCLTDGIEEAGFTAHGKNGAALLAFTGEAIFMEMVAAGEWHTTREAAVACANRMRDAEVAQLEQQAEKLRRIIF